MPSDFHFDIRRGRSDIDDDFENATGISSDAIIDTVAAVRNGTYAQAGSRTAQLSGVDLTGVTSASSALLAALTAVPDGGELLLPAGTFNLTDWTVQDVTKRITVRGAGSGATVLVGSGSNDFLSVNASIRVTGCKFSHWATVIDLTPIVTMIDYVRVIDNSFDDCIRGVYYDQAFGPNEGITRFQILRNEWTNGRLTADPTGVTSTDVTTTDGSTDFTDNAGTLSLSNSYIGKRIQGGGFPQGTRLLAILGPNSYRATAPATTALGAGAHVSLTMVKYGSGFASLNVSRVDHALAHGNYVDTAGNIGIGIGYDALAVGVFSEDTLSDIIISNNTVKNVFGTGTSNVFGIFACGRQVTITDNIVDSVTCPTSSNVDGIYTKARWFSIVGNVLRNAGGHEAMIDLKGQLRLDVRQTQGYAGVCSQNTMIADTTECAFGINIACESVIVSENFIQGVSSRGIVTSSSASGDDVSIVNNKIIGQRFGVLFADAVLTSASATLQSATAAFVSTDGPINVTDAVTNGTTTVTSATANFSVQHEGRPISGTNIPAGATILWVQSSTTVTISVAASGSGSGGTLAVAGVGVAGYGIPSGTTISAVTDSTHATMSVNATATASGTTFLLARPVAPTMTDGIRIAGPGSRIQVLGNQVYHVLTYAMYCGKSGGLDVTIRDNMLMPMGDIITAPTTYGLRVDNSAIVTRTRIKGNYFAYAKHLLAFTSTAGDDVEVEGNRFGPNVGTSPTKINKSVTPTNLAVKRNTGYVTEASGAATVASGATTAVVTHGLDITPSINDISLTKQNKPTNTVSDIWVSTITSTQFTINASADPGAGGLTVGWTVRS